jgi:hypothetical protein
MALTTKALFDALYGDRDRAPTRVRYAKDKPKPTRPEPNLESEEGKPQRRKKGDSQEDGDAPIIGVDGEGQDTPDGGHIYTYLAAVDEFGKLVADAWDPNGLSHEACARLLLSLPPKSLKFGFMFSYDVTMIVEELPLVDRYYLMRPNLRDEAICPECRTVHEAKTSACPDCAGELRQYTRAVRFNRRSYNYFNGSLTIGQGHKTVKIWDCFRFFGCAFVSALEDWKIGTSEQVARILGMKQKRGAFEHESPEEIQRYCQEECHLLAQMMRKVKTAHELAEIPLTRYEGAGSTATALLRANEVSSYKGSRHADLAAREPGLGRAIAAAFFGGRFEDSMVGIVRQPVYGFDISSAYPFALTFMPCLACGSWRLEKGVTPEKLATFPLAVVAFRVRALGPRARKGLAWGPLPCRDQKGSISYGTNFSGWAWKPELLSAIAGWPELVELTGEAWVYETSCAHTPFSFLPKVYRKRIEWGKEGAGKALKLGANASYGKTAQSIGDDPPFQSWTWAGMTTATTRSQLLDAMRTSKDLWSILTVATDGIYSLEDLPVGPAPRDTGTFDLPKPLGGWERKEIEEGVFVVKPGLYYRLKGDLADVRARGVGRREVHSARQKIEAGFLAWDRKDLTHHVPLQSRRFYGCKHSILARSSCAACKKSWPGVPEKGCPKCGQVGTDFQVTHAKTDAGEPAYGRWGLRDVKIGFDPYPKREREGLSRGGSFCRLHLRDLGGIDSAPYDVGTAETTPEGEAMRAAKELQLEQPDWDDEIRADG